MYTIALLGAEQMAACIVLDGYEAPLEATAEESHGLVQPSISKPSAVKLDLITTRRRRH
jgi:hypothetical protein